MNEQEIVDYRNKLALNPETGTREVEVRELSKDVYDELAPYIKEEIAWPVVEGAGADDDAAAIAAAEAEAAAIAAAAASETPENKTVILAQPPREVVVAKSTIERARARADKFKADVAALNAEIAEPLPDRYLDEDAYFDALQKRSDAINKKADLASSYTMARDVEDVEMAEKVVHQSEFSRTVESIGEAYEPLKLPRDFDTMVGEYESIMRLAMSEIGTEDAQVAYDKIQADPEFAKKVGSLPISEYETLFIYMHAEEARKKNGGSLKGHVLELAHDQGIFKKMRESDKDAAKRAIADKNDKALHARATEQKPASVTAGATDAPAGPIVIRDAESARKWLVESQAIRANKNAHLTDAQKIENTKKDRLAREYLLDSGTQRPLQMPV